MSRPSKVTVRFEEVGRAKRTWEVDATDIPLDDVDLDGTPSAEWLAAEAKRNGGLMSNDIGVDGDDLGDLGVYAGFRRVGTCRVTVVP